MSNIGEFHHHADDAPDKKSRTMVAVVIAIAIAAFPAAIIHTGIVVRGSCANAALTSPPGSTAAIPACAMCRRSVLRVREKDVSDCVWDLRRRGR